MTDIQDAYEDFCTSITDKTEPLPAYKFFEAGYKAGSAAKEEQLKCCGACKWWLCMSMACAHSEPILQHAKVSDCCEHFKPRGKE